MKQVIKKEEVKQKMFDLSILRDHQDDRDVDSEQEGGSAHDNDELDLSREIEEAEMCPRRLHVRPFLDFRDEEKLLQEAIE